MKLIECDDSVMLWILVGRALSHVPRMIYASVDNDHEKLRDFAEILLLSPNTSSLAIELLKEYCKFRILLVL